MIEFEEVSLGLGGGSCRFCGGGSTPSYRSAEEIADEVARLADRGGPGAGLNVAFVGPEPFGHDSLPTIVRDAARARVSRIRLDTSGSPLGRAEVAQWALEAGVRQIRTALFAGSASAHDALAPASDGMEAVVAGMRRFRGAADEAGIRVAVSVVVPVCRHNVDALPSTVVAAVKAGADLIVLSVRDPGLDPAAVMPWAAAACDTGTVNGVWVEIEGIPFGVARGYELHVANMVRRSLGHKPDTCRACALVEWFDGALQGAASGVGGLFQPPPEHQAMARAIGRARGPGS